MKDVVTRYTFDKCWPNSVNKSLSTMVLALKLLMYVEILPVLKVRLKFRLLKALPSSLNSFLRILEFSALRVHHAVVAQPRKTVLSSSEPRCRQ